MAHASSSNALRLAAFDFRMTDSLLRRPRVLIYRAKNGHCAPLCLPRSVPRAPARRLGSRIKPLECCSPSVHRLDVNKR